MLFLLQAALAAQPSPLAEIYASDDADRRALLANIVFVPGILGSQIVDETDGRLYWGEVFGQAAKPSRRPGDLRKLALPMVADASEIRDVDDELGAGDMLFKVQVNTPFGRLQARGYPGVFEGLVISTLVDGDDTRRVRLAETDDLPFTAFGYDWRRDIPSQAAALHEVVVATAAEGEPVTLIGHSMGALVVRYYLRYGPADLPMDGPLPEPTWAGAEHVRHALLVAPPNAGSPAVFRSLDDGERVNAMLPRYPPALTGTFPSLYQMLPRTRHDTVVADGETVDLFDPEQWVSRGLGALADDQSELVDVLLADVDEADRRDALEAHVRACLARAARFQAALDQPSEHPDTLFLHLFAGDRHRTPAVLDISGASTWRAFAPGDGSVTRRSALLDERPVGAGGRLDAPVGWDTVWFGRAEHFGISRDLGFLDNALYLLLEHPL